MNQLRKKLEEMKPFEKRKEKFRQALQEIVKLLKKEKKVSAIILFGSMARGDFSPLHSDIDLFVVIDSTKEVPLLEKDLSLKAIESGNKYKTTLHLTFQYLKAKREDQSLLRKLAGEGKVLYSKDLLIVSKELLGLKPFELIIFDTKEASQLQRTKFSRFLHGATLWYKKGEEKVIKEYKGIADNKSVFEAGKGALLISVDKVEKFQELAEEMGIKVKSKGLFYR